MTGQIALSNLNPGEYERAEEAFETAIQLNFNSPAAFVGLAEHMSLWANTIAANTPRNVEFKYTIVSDKCLDSPYDSKIKTL